HGVLNADALEANVPALGIEVTGGRARAELEELERLTFSAELCSDGCVVLEGRARIPREGDWHIESTIEGTGFELVDMPELRAIGAPNLTLEADPTLVRMSGDLAISDASIEIEDVPRTAVRPAPETVVHGREEPAVEDDVLP